MSKIGDTQCLCYIADASTQMGTPLDPTPCYTELQCVSEGMYSVGVTSSRTHSGHQPSTFRASLLSSRLLCILEQRLYFGAAAKDHRRRLGECSASTGIWYVRHAMVHRAPHQIGDMQVAKKERIAEMTDLPAPPAAAKSAAAQAAVDDILNGTGKGSGAEWLQREYFRLMIREATLKQQHESNLRTRRVKRTVTHSNEQRNSCQNKSTE